MKYADRLKFTASGVAADTITVGAAAAGCRTLAQVLSSPNSPMAIGDVNIPLIIMDGSGSWEAGLFTITNSTKFTRTRTVTSSNSGQAVTFDGNGLTVFNAPLATHYIRGLTDFYDAGYDIVLCIGQSNMCGRDNVDALVDMVNANALQFGGANGDARYQTIFSAANPMHNAEGVGTGKTGPQTAFATAYQSTIPTNRQVLLVPCAYGGTSLVASGVNGFTPAAWNASGGQLSSNAVSQANLAVTEAQKFYPNSRVVGMIWIQGESDGDNSITQASYAAGLTSLIAYLRSNITGASNAWFVIGGMCPEVIASYAGYPAIRLAHMQVANATAKCAYVDGVSGYRLDSYHYTAKGARIMGARMAQAIPTAIANAGIVTPATAVTLSPSSASTPINTAITVTVGTDYPLTGSQSETVTLTAPVAGTWSANPVTLNASTGSASPTFTPTATGSGNITAAASGTSTLTGASAAFTCTAAATVPGAPTIGAATASSGGASVAFSPPASNGGSAITGYTATSTPGGFTGTGTASPIAVSGLTNGTAYTFTVHATNSVGNSAESAASNSVTPSAPAASTWNPADKNATFTLSTDKLTATSGSSNASWASLRATSAKSSGKYYFEFKYTGSTNRVIVGLGNSSATLTGFVGSDANGYGCYASDGGIFNNGSENQSGTPTPFAAGDIIGVQVDFTSSPNRMYITKNGTATTNIAIAAGTYYPMASTDQASIGLILNPSPTPPAGYTAWG